MAVSVEAAGPSMNVVVAALVGNPDEVTRDIAAAARHRARACMITTPPFVRPSDSDVAEFITRVAARSTLPLIIFNVPSRTGFLMSPPLIARVAGAIDLLAGIKESSRAIVQFGEVRRRCAAPFACLQGVDALYLPSIAIGGDGGILAAAAVFPEYCVAIERAVAADRPRQTLPAALDCQPAVRSVPSCAVEGGSRSAGPPCRPDASAALWHIGGPAPARHRLCKHAAVVNSRGRVANDLRCLTPSHDRLKLDAGVS